MSVYRPEPAISLGHLLMSVPFVLGGWQALRNPGPLPKSAAALGLPQPQLLTGVVAAAMLTGGAAVGSGVAPVVGGALLAASLAGTTIVVHGFWRESDPTAKAAHRRAFVANCGLLGAAVVATVQTHQLQRSRCNDA